MALLSDWIRAPLFVAVFQFVIYIGFLLLSAAAALEIIARLTAALRPSWRVGVSVFAAASDRMWAFGAPYLGWAVILCGIVIVGTGNADLLFQFPSPGSVDRDWAETFATLGLFLWMTSGLAGVGGTAILNVGLTSGEDVKLARHMQHATLMLVCCCLLLPSILWPGPLAVFGVFAALASAVILHFNGIRLVAFIRRSRSPRASALALLPCVKRPYAIHVSDVHYTMEGSDLIQGGTGGNKQLRLVVNRWKGDRSVAPTFVLLTGDVIDRGRAEEWREVSPLLIQLKQSGIRVILAPGNHDLATAYDHAVAYPLMAKSSRRLRVVDTHRIRDYLAIAAELEPGLVSYDGRPVAQLIREEEQQFTTFIETWRSAAAAAATYLNKGRTPSDAHPASLAALRRSDPAQAAQILESVLDRAAAVLGSQDLSWARESLADYLCSRRQFTLDPVTEQGLRWRRFWYGCFPLRVVDETSQVEFVIVNSNEPEPGLFGSGFGRLGTSQLERLKDIVAACTAQTLIILMHHPICGWVQETDDQHGPLWRVNLDRWAFLAHETRECHQVIELLGQHLPEACTRIYLSCGHRHGRSRIGHAVADHDDTTAVHQRLFLMESAALLDLSFDGSEQGSSLLALSRDSSGSIVPCRTVIQQLTLPENP
jgi:hypothetical protein